MIDKKKNKKNLHDKQEQSADALLPSTIAPPIGLPPTIVPPIGLRLKDVRAGVVVCDGCDVWELLKL